MNNRCHEKFFKFTFSERQLAKNNLVQLYWASVVPIGILIFAVAAGVPLLPTNGEDIEKLFTEDLYIIWVGIIVYFLTVYFIPQYIECGKLKNAVNLCSHTISLCSLDRDAFLQSYTLVDDKYYVLRCKSYKRFGVRNTIIFDKAKFEQFLALFDVPSQETDLLIDLHLDAGVVVPIDRICEQLLAEFPGAVVTAENSFEARRMRLEELRQYSQERLRNGTLEPWSWKTMDELNEGIDQIIARIRRAELIWGPRKDLAIPLGGGTQLEGQVGVKSIIFRGHCQRSDLTVAKLVRFLESLHLGQVDILLPPQPPSSENSKL